jgi:hypothetical protein
VNDETKKPEEEPLDVAGAALVVLGLVLPIAGIAWGPGAWWQYAIWLLIGGAAVWIYGYTHGYGRSS